MRKTRVYCDHCGKELNEMHDYIEQDVGFYEDNMVDLCADCFSGLDKIIKAYCSKEAMSDVRRQI